MARSPSDATRFTATGPYISNKPSSSNGPSFSANQPNPTSAAASASQIQLGQAPPPNETPQQKIARLRAAANAAKLGKESSFDRTVRVGRIWADRAHRVTAITLIGLTVVSGAVATAGITDMLLHNRRRKKEWLAEQQRKSAIALAEAKEAFAAGAASDDQILLINRERAASVAEETRRNAPGAVTRAKNWLFSGLSKEEQKGGKLGAATAIAGANVRQTSEAEGDASAETIKNVMPSVGAEKGVFETMEDKLEAHRRQGEKIEAVLSPLGGPLDQHAQLITNSARNSGKSWLGWVMGR